MHRDSTNKPNLLISFTSGIGAPTEAPNRCAHRAILRQVRSSVIELRIQAAGARITAAGDRSRNKARPRSSAAGPLPHTVREQVCTTGLAEAGLVPSVLLLLMRRGMGRGSMLTRIRAVVTTPLCELGLLPLLSLQLPPLLAWAKASMRNLCAAVGDLRQ